MLPLTVTPPVTLPSTPPIALREALGEKRSERGTPREALRERGTQREALRERHSKRGARREALGEEAV
jgi:hypothetical protein